MSARQHHRWRDVLGVSGKHASRPEFDKCLAYLREGDALVINRLARVMRSMRELIVEGTNEGLAAARARAGSAASGRSAGEARAGVVRAAGHTVAAIAQLLGVSRQTVYRALDPKAVTN